MAGAKTLSPYQAGATGIPIYVGDVLGGSLLYQWMGAPKTVKFYPEASKLWKEHISFSSC